MSKEKPGLDFKSFSKVEQVEDASGMEGFSNANKDLALQLKEISLKSRINITKSEPETFPELDITQEKLKESYEKQPEIINIIITPPLDEEKLIEDMINIMGEDKIDQSE